MRRPILRLFTLLLFGLLALPLSAQQPPRPGTPFPGTPPAGPDRVITILNRAPQAITTLFVSASTEDEWGINRLSIPSLATTRSFQYRLGGRDCKYDFQVTYADKRVEEKRDQDICRSRQIVFDATSAKAPDTGPERTVTVRNRTPRPITKIFISPKSTTSWGDDVLKGNLAGGADQDVRYRGECIADLRIVYDNDSAEERREIDFCANTTAYIVPGWTITDEMPTKETDIPNFSEARTAQTGEPLTVINHTGKTIEYLYVFPDGADAEGPDRLGNNTLDDQDRFEFRVDRGDKCQFTLRGEYTNSGGEIRLSGVDLCRENEVTLSNDPADRSAPGAATPRVPSRPPEGPIAPGTARLRNRGAAEAVAVFADPVGAERTLDRLGDRSLEPGDSFDITPPVAGQCAYQLVVLYRDGRKGEGKADLCGGAEVVLP